MARSINNTRLYRSINNTHQCTFIPTCLLNMSIQMFIHTSTTHVGRWRGPLQLPFMSISVHTCLHRSVRTLHTFLHPCLHTCLHMPTHMSPGHVCACKCIHVNARVFPHVYTHVYTHVDAHVCTPEGDNCGFASEQKGDLSSSLL